MNKKKHLPLISGIVVLGIILWITFFCEYSFWRKSQVSLQLKHVKENITALELENKQLENDNELLENDPKVWEREARNIGMQKKGEQVIIFQKKPDGEK